MGDECDRVRAGCYIRLQRCQSMVGSRQGVQRIPSLLPCRTRGGGEARAGKHHDLLRPCRNLQQLLQSFLSIVAARGRAARAKGQ